MAHKKSDSDLATDGLLMTKERTIYYLTTPINSFSVSTINTSSIFIIQGAHLCAPVLSAAEGMVSRLKPLLQQNPMSM